MAPQVGRPREFDEQEVLDRALATFWDRGFEATSVNDLVEATGLNKGSLYQAFGDKRSLFLRTLADYLSNGRLGIERRLAVGGSLKECFSAVMLPTCSAENKRRGCYAVNCLAELAPHDSEVKDLIAAHYKHVERLFAKAIAADRKATHSDRAKPSSLEPALLARLLVTLMAGVATASKGHLDSSSARQVVFAALDELL